MSILRQFAIKLLSAVVRTSPEESRDWASAMLRELDFIEGDWAALFWALGSTTVIFRYSGRQLLVRFQNQRVIKKVFMNVFQKRALGFIAGSAIALVAAIAILALIHLSADLFSLGNPERMSRTAWALIAALSEGAVIVAAIALWRKRRPMAVGILLSAIAIGAHVAIHLSTHVLR